MRLLRRNTRVFEYLPYEGVTDGVDTYGRHTGEPVRKYGDPVEYRGSISIPNGQMNPTFYGADLRYTHTLILDNPKADIHEGGVIRWQGDLYDVVAVRPSLNVLSAALVKQTVNHAESDGT